MTLNHSIITMVVATAISALMVKTSLPMSFILLFMFVLFSVLLLFILPQWAIIILFIVYVGGLLVLLTYFLSTGPNNKLMGAGVGTIGLMVCRYKLKKMKAEITTFSLNLPPMESLLLSQNSEYILILVITLFLALVCVVNMTKKSRGPLRPQG